MELVKGQTRLGRHVLFLRFRVALVDYLERIDNVTTLLLEMFRHWSICLAAAANGEGISRNYSCSANSRGSVGQRRVNRL